MRKKLRPNILVIEDDEAILSFLLEFFNDFTPYRAFGTDGGAKALKLLAAVRFDGITLDLQLADMHGTTFLEELAERGVNNIPVIVISANSREIATVYPQVKGIIGKPFDVDNLLEVLEDLLP